MTVETNARFVSQLNESYPRDRDLIKEGDNHIRLVKSVLKNTFPGFTSAATMTSDEFNKLDKAVNFDSDNLVFVQDVKFSSDKRLNMNDNRITNLKDPVDDTDAVSLKFVKNSIGGVAWPVGSMFMTVDDRDPSVLMGFGKWEKINGRMLLGSGAGTDSSGVVKSFRVGESGGNYIHKITVDELPNHSHDAAGASSYSAQINVQVPSNTTDATKLLGKIPSFRVSGPCKLLCRAVVNVSAGSISTSFAPWIRVTKNGQVVAEGRYAETIHGDYTGNSVNEFPFSITEAGDFAIECYGYNYHSAGTATAKHITLSVAEINA